MMEAEVRLSEFMEAIKLDGCISVRHIATYAVLLDLWAKNNFINPLCFNGCEVSVLAKLSIKTYYRCLKDLDGSGYIRYIPSLKRNRTSKIFLIGMKKVQYD